MRIGRCCPMIQPVDAYSAPARMPHYKEYLYMSNDKTIRAWKDAEQRDALSEHERATLKPNPAGEIELTDAELSKIQGGCDPLPPTTTITTIIGGGALPEVNE